MPGKLNLYGLGDKGIDLVSTPLHQEPNSWRKLQNAEFSNIEGQGGVKKRGGLLKLNTAALNSGASIQALFNMPLETTVFDATGTLFAVLGDQTGVYFSTDNGTTFTVVPGTGAESYGVILTAIGGFAYGYRLDDGAIVKIASTGVTIEQAASPAGELTLVHLTRSATKLWALWGVGGPWRVYSWVPGGSPAQFGSDFTFSLTDGGVEDVVRLAVNAAEDTAIVTGLIFSDAGAFAAHMGMWTGTGGGWSFHDSKASLPLHSVAGAQAGIIGTNLFQGINDISVLTTNELTDGSSALVSSPSASSAVVDAVARDTFGIVCLPNAGPNQIAYVSDDGVTWTSDEDLTSTFSIAVSATIRFFITADGTTWMTAGGVGLFQRTVGGVWSLVHDGTGLPANFEIVARTDT